MIIDLFEDWWKKQQNLKLIATGRRIVHGEKIFNKLVIVNEKVSEDLRPLIPLKVPCINLIICRYWLYFFKNIKKSHI